MDFWQIENKEEAILRWKEQCAAIRSARDFGPLHSDLAPLETAAELQLRLNRAEAVLEEIQTADDLHVVKAILTREHARVVCLLTEHWISTEPHAYSHPDLYRNSPQPWYSNAKVLCAYIRQLEAKVPQSPETE